VIRAVRRLAAAAVLLLAALFAPTPAPAASSSFTLGAQSVVQVWAGNHAQVTIRAWSRPTIQFDTDDESVQVERRSITFGTPQNPLSQQIPPMMMKVRDPLGGTTGVATFPPEDFPYAAEFRAGVHDTVRIVVAAESHVTVMVPSTIALLDARLRGAGDMLIDGYHGSTLFASTYSGRLTLSNVSSASFLQTSSGRIAVSGSSFDRLRARANNATVVFRDDSARQIEVTTISGPIVWDNGGFDAGLARFESTIGPIAIGVSGGAQLEARSGDGRVFWLWNRRTMIDARGDNEASATVGGGGPLVSAVSAHGNIFLYDDSLPNRRIIPLEWRRINAILRPSELAPGAPLEPPTQPAPAGLPTPPPA
jgi:hypothetical protein